MNNEYLFFVGIRSRRKGQRELGFGETAPKRGQRAVERWAALLFLGTDVLLHSFGGDSSGGFGTVGGLNVGRRRGDRAPCFAGRDTDGEGDQEERHDD